MESAFRAWLFPELALRPGVDHGYEFNPVLMCTGPGRWSVDGWRERRRQSRPKSLASHEASKNQGSLFQCVDLRRSHGRSS